MNAFFAVVARDLRLAFRRKAEVLSGLFFFVVVAALFPLAIGPEAVTLRHIGPGVLWVGALLASMLTLPRLFENDWRDGSLEHLVLSPHPLGLLVLGKILAHWLVSGLPLVALAPLLGLQFDLPSDALGMLALSLLLGTPVLSCIGAIGAALTLVGSAFVCACAGVWCWRRRGFEQWFGCASTCFNFAGDVVASCVFQPLGMQCGFAHCLGMTK